MDQAAIREAARLLLSARRARAFLDDWPERLRPGSIADAYRVQAALAEAIDEPLAGWKIGATSAAAQAMLGTDEPFSGRVFASLVAESPQAYAPGELIAAFIECEFAVRLCADLAKGARPHDAAGVAGAVAAVLPAFEVVEPRSASFRELGVNCTIADNGLHGRLVLGAPYADWRKLDLERHPVGLAIDGKAAAAGTAGDALGGTLEALAWLANDLNARSEKLGAGQVVTTGTCTGLVPAPPGAECVADFGALGRISLTVQANE